MNDIARRETLLGLVSAAIAEHDRWASRSDLSYVTAGVDEAMSDLVDGFAEGTIPGDCREMGELVAVFGREWHAWQAEVDRRGSATIPPGESAWKAWEQVAVCYQGVVEPPRQPLESIKTLREQKVADRQICEIYGWMDARGCPEAWKVEEELAEPGKHTANWVDPVTQRRREAAERQRGLAERVKRLRERKVAAMGAVCPESLEDLVRQGIALVQVAEMLRLTEEQVLAQCEAQNLPRPPLGPSLHAKRGAFEPDLPEPMARQFAAHEAEGARRRQEDGGLTATGAADTEGDRQPSIEERIVQYHEQGFAPADIAAELSGAGAKVSERRVKAVITRYENDPDSIKVTAN